MKGFYFRLPREYLEGLQDLVRIGHYPTVAEAIRIAIRDLLIAEKKWVRGDDHEG